MVGLKRMNRFVFELDKRGPCPRLVPVPGHVTPSFDATTTITISKAHFRFSIRSCPAASGHTR